MTPSEQEGDVYRGNPADCEPGFPSKTQLRTWADWLSHLSATRVVTPYGESAVIFDYENRKSMLELRAFLLSQIGKAIV